MILFDKLWQIVTSLDGSLIAAIFKDNTIRFLDVRKNRTCIIGDLSESIKIVSISNDERFLAAGDYNGNIYLWETSGRLIDKWPGHVLSIECLSFSPNGTLLASVGSDTMLRIWNVPSCHQIWAWRSQSYEVYPECVLFSPDGRLLACRTGRKIAVLEAATGHLLWQHTDPNPIRSMVFSPSGDMFIATASCIRMLSASGDMLWIQHRKEDRFFVRIALSMDGNFLVATASQNNYEKNFLSVWDTSKGTIVGETEAPTCKHLAISPDGKFVVIGDSKTIWVWEVKTDKFIWSKDIPGFISNFLEKITFFDDLILVANDEGLVYLLDVRSGQLCSIFFMGIA